MGVLGGWVMRRLTWMVPGVLVLGLSMCGPDSDGDPLAPSSIIESVESVRAADVQQVARREFTRDRMQLVVFANKQKTGTGLLRRGE
jgi:hypothetical protein